MFGSTDSAVRIAAVLAVLVLASCQSFSSATDPASDAPDARSVRQPPLLQVRSYSVALQVWRSADDINAWIGARFEYDSARALRLSETQREQSGRLPAHAPREFFNAPSGVCVDLARFAVESLRAIEPQAKPQYVMIEFDPTLISGNILRRHWLASFERAGQRYFFADSKRPGYIAGPYESTQAVVDDYARYRGRSIVAFRETETYQRTQRTVAAPRAPTPCADHRCTKTPPPS